MNLKFLSCYKENSTGKDQITVCGGDGRRQGDQWNSSCVCTSSEGCTNSYNRIRLWKYKKIGQKGDYKGARKSYFVLHIHMNSGGHRLPYLKGWMVNKTAGEELYLLQVAKIFCDFTGVHNTQSIYGLMSKIKLKRHHESMHDNRCTCYVPK